MRNRGNNNTNSYSEIYDLEQKSKLQRQLKPQCKDGQNGAVERLQIQKLGDKNFYPGAATS